MKIILTADIHVGVPDRLDDIFWALKKIRSYAHKNDIGTWIILGDLLHNRESIGIRDLQTLVQFLEETDSKYHQTIHAFPGNHDMVLRDCWDINSLKTITRYITYHGDIGHITLSGRRFWIVPFIHYESEYMQAIEKVEKEYQDGDVLLTHIGIKNATLNTCFLLKSWSIVDFSNSKFDKIYTGHFHTHQQVGDNVWYPGSPIPFKFDEGDVDHGFFVYDTDSNTHEFISIWADSDEDKPPQFMTIGDDVLNSDDIDIEGNIVRITLSKDYTTNQLTELRQSICDRGAKDVRWMNLSSKEEIDNINQARDKIASASDLFNKFIESDKAGTKHLNKELLIRINQEITADGDKLYMAT